MSDSGDQPNRMAEIAGLAASLADRILEKQEAGTSIPPELFRMLVQAARILHDNDVPWPPSVDFLVMEVGRRIEAEEAEPGDGAARLTKALDAAKRPDPA